MRQKGHRIIDYIDDYIGVALPSVAPDAFDALVDVVRQFGLTISEKKLVSPSTQVTCLGVLIDSIKGTIQIPPQKLKQILDTVHQWRGRTHCSKRQLQSLLGLPLFVHKCVKPARIFLNRMLMTLRQAHVTQKIELSQDFKRDLKWFEKFLPSYNGISLYQHKNVDSVLDLDACLTGLVHVGAIGCTIFPFS